MEKRLRWIVMVWLAAVPVYSAENPVVEVTMVADKETLNVGEIAMVTVSARIKDGIRANTIQIFSWYLDLVNSDSAVASVLSEIEKPSSDRDEKISS